MLKYITPVIISYNEQANIDRTLQQLTWVENVVVMDSFSNDQTQQICQNYSNVTFVQREFYNFANQCSAAIKDPSITTEWVMSLDSDYVVPESLVQELAELAPEAEVDAYRCGFIYCVNGESIGDSLYPPRIVLARKAQLRFKMDGHAHRRSVAGRVDSLQHKILHDDRKSQTDWQANQKQYAKQEAEKLLSETSTTFPSSGWVRKYLSITPTIVQLYLLVIRGMLFRGSNARLYIQQRVYFERLLQQALKSARKSKNKFNNKPI